MVEHQGPARASWNDSCSQIFEPPGCVTLWRLPEAIEEEFDARWDHWLDEAASWQPFFGKLENRQSTDLITTPRVFEVVFDRGVEAFSRLWLSTEGWAVTLPGVFSATDDGVDLLALGFARLIGAGKKIIVQ